MRWTVKKNKLSSQQNATRVLQGAFAPSPWRTPHHRPPWWTSALRGSPPPHSPSSSPRRLMTACWVRVEGAELLKRVWTLDALECPRCKDRMTAMALVENPEGHCAVPGAYRPGHRLPAGPGAAGPERVGHAPVCNPRLASVAGQGLPLPEPRREATIPAHDPWMPRTGGRTHGAQAAHLAVAPHLNPRRASHT